MKLSTWFKKNGFPNLGRAMQQAEEIVKKELV